VAGASGWCARATCQSVDSIEPAGSFDSHFPFVAAARTNNGDPPVTRLLTECMFDRGDNLGPEGEIARVLHFDDDCHDVSYCSERSASSCSERSASSGVVPFGPRSSRAFGEGQAALLCRRNPESCSSRRRLVDNAAADLGPPDLGNSHLSPVTFCLSGPS
jgi:hypothetical protein